jgi:hypothetical protein
MIQKKNSEKYKMFCFHTYSYSSFLLPSGRKYLKHWVVYLGNNIKQVLFEGALKPQLNAHMIS